MVKSDIQFCLNNPSPRRSCDPEKIKETSQPGSLYLLVDGLRSEDRLDCDVSESDVS